MEAGSQVLIATHSPILMAYPDAEILLLADGAPSPVAYRDTEHYQVTRSFLTRTGTMLDILLDRGAASDPRPIGHDIVSVDEEPVDREDTQGGVLPGHEQ